MPRPPEYDRQEVLQQAMRLFWRKGYHATSMKDLTTATGLQPGSLYGAFHSKRSLFLEALETYYEMNMAGHDERLRGRGTPKERIRGVFERLLELAAEDGDNKGCMMINTLLETPGEDEEINGRLRSMFESAEERLLRVVIEAQNMNQIDPQKDPRVVAQSLLMGMQGVRIFCKSRPNQDALQRSVDNLLDSILK